jgi:hypothetical protein
LRSTGHAGIANGHIAKSDNLQRQRGRSVWVPAVEPHQIVTPTFGPFDEFQQATRATQVRY